MTEVPSYEESHDGSTAVFQVDRKSNPNPASSAQRDARKENGRRVQRQVGVIRKFDLAPAL